MFIVIFLFQCGLHTLIADGIHSAPARGMLRAVGMGDDDFAKPQIGIAS